MTDEIKKEWDRVLEILKMSPKRKRIISHSELKQLIKEGDCYGQ